MSLDALGKEKPVVSAFEQRLEYILCCFHCVVMPAGSFFNDTRYCQQKRNICSLQKEYGDEGSYFISPNRFSKHQSISRKVFFFFKSFARPAASTTTSHKHGRHGLSEAWLYSFSTRTSYGLWHTVYNIAFSEAWSRVQASPPAQSDVFPSRSTC